MDNAGEEQEIETVKSIGWFSVFTLLVMATPVIAFSGFSIMLLSTFLPLWGAVLVGVPVGIGVFVVSIAGEKTLMEIGIRCFICMALLFILFPVFKKAKQNAERHRFQEKNVQVQNH